MEGRKVFGHDFLRFSLHCDDGHHYLGGALCLLPRGNAIYKKEQGPGNRISEMKALSSEAYIGNRLTDNQLKRVAGGLCPS